MGQWKKKTMRILRVNVNAIDKKKLADPTFVVCDKNCGTGVKHEKLSHYSKEVTALYPAYAVARLAYASGKLYYLNSKKDIAATLVSTDVRVSIDCASILPLFAPRFKNWTLDHAR